MTEEKKAEKKALDKEIKEFYKKVKDLPPSARKSKEERRKAFERKLKAIKTIQAAFRARRNKQAVHRDRHYHDPIPFLEQKNRSIRRTI